METAQKGLPTTNLVLTDLLNIIESFGTQEEMYINQARIFSVDVELMSKNCTDNEYVSLQFLESLGIDRLVSQSSIEVCQSIPGMKGKSPEVNRWYDLKQDILLVENLKALFKSNQIISFSNWADVINGSDLWYGLLSDVIKPLIKNDFKFIFYLGDSTKRLFFEVDEILDIISEFSLYGRVTFALDEQEAANLWALLNGKKGEDSFFKLDESGARRKYSSLFNTMNIENLVIYSERSALLFCGETQFEMARRISDRSIAQKADRDSFIVGYCLGLSQMREVTKCLGLGIIVCGAYVDNGAVPTKQMLVDYTKKWISEIESS